MLRNFFSKLLSANDNGCVLQQKNILNKPKLKPAQPFRQMKMQMTLFLCFCLRGFKNILHDVKKRFGYAWPILFKERGFINKTSTIFEIGVPCK